MAESWAVAPSAAFDLRSWNEEMVVFVHSTGHTHALSLEASTVLATMLDSPDLAQPADMWFKLFTSDVDAAVPGTGADHADLQQVERLLFGLESIGVVVRRQP